MVINMVSLPNKKRPWEDGEGRLFKIILVKVAW